ncbi:hypothetical protein NS365_01320 [Aureimonas ureilytica]|uniref:Fe-S oxidoreductase n=1 Tax=Aureimonas ureilytica TaxID=401562 RepID=A0A175RXX4_9HYPH|nr:DUF1289 domain-containing protein [Aureimonas ureilytica]KTR08301.1 hypothetical protein NS365_01320 [Aureimonas ureilytica]
MPKVPSPCTDVCQYDARNQWCLGCGRTRDEIKTWQKLTPFRRTALERELRRRLDRLDGTKARPR